MASADIAKELNSQLKGKVGNDSSEAEKICVVETNSPKSGTSGENQKAKKKGGLFKRFKNAVKAPLRKRHRSGVYENGTDKHRTKSTSDLTDTAREESEGAHDHDSKAKVFKCSSNFLLASVLLIIEKEYYSSLFSIFLNR